MPARASTRASNSDSGTVDVEALVFHTDLFLAALAVVYILAQLPALLARFSSGSEWRGWHLLRPSRVRAAEPLPYPRPLDSEAYTASNARRHIHDGEISEVHTDVSHTTSPISEPASQAHLKRRTTTAHRRLHKDAEGSPPRHVKAWSSRFPRLASILRHPLEQGTSVGQGLLLLVFTCVLVYPTLYHSNPFTDPLRAGYVALAQLPVVVALAVRNNPAGMLAGVSYEKLNFVHRLAGKIVVLTVDIHAIGYAYRWYLQGSFDRSVKVPFITWGIVAFAFTNALYVFSLPIFRRRLHNFFKLFHVLSSIALVVSLIYHLPRLRRWLVACALIYAFDLAVRLLKTRICTATITSPEDAAGMVIIHIPGLGSGWRAGQHVRIRILARALGGVRWAEAHPLTIAGPPRAPDGSGMTLLLQRAGAWSSALHTLALSGDEGAAERNRDADRESRMPRLSRVTEYTEYLEKTEMEPARVRVLVEGPYGGVGHTQPASFAGALLVAGGAGLSFALAILGDVLRARGGGPRSIRLIWAVRDPAAAAPFLRALDALLANKPSGVEVAAVVRYTRAVEDPELRLLLPPGVVVEPGRPALRREFDDMARRTLRLTRETHWAGRGLLVAACGPEGMCRDVGRAVNGLDGSVREALGGVEYLRESFGS